MELTSTGWPFVETGVESIAGVLAACFSSFRSFSPGFSVVFSATDGIGFDFLDFP